MKILVAVPTFETIEPEVFKAIYNLKSEHELTFEYVRGYDCAVARNEIGKLCLAKGFDYVLMVDSDTLIPEDTIELMLDPPVDIVFGVCPRKNTKDGKSAIVKRDSESYHSCYYYHELPSERTKVKGGGCACALIRASVFEDIEYPWFKYVVNDDYSTLSEDYYFCQQAALAGIDIWMDPRVRCGHLARYYQFD